MTVLAGAAHRPSGEQLLDPLEGGPIDQRIVAGGVLDAVPFDEADVGPVGEEVGETRDGHGLGRVVAVAPAVAKAPVGHLVGQALDDPLIPVCGTRAATDGTLPPRLSIETLGLSGTTGLDRRHRRGYQLGNRFSRGGPNDPK